MEGQHVNTLQAFLLAGLQRGNLPPECHQRLIFRAVSLEYLGTACVAVQIFDVMRFIEQLLTVILAVNVDQIRRQLPQDSRTGRLHIHAAGALAVRGNLPLNVQRVRLVTGKRKLVKQFAQSTRQIGEHRADKALLRTRAHQITADALAEQRTDRVNNNTLACTRLAGKHGQTLIEFDVCAFDDRYIFNVE